MRDVRLTSRDNELLLDLKEQGAALAEDLRRWFPSSAALRMRVVQLACAGYIEVIRWHGGQRILALGPRGKRHLGIRSNWRTRPQEALREVMWRQCHAELAAEGYREIGTWRHGLVLYRKPFGPVLAVQVFATGPTVRHLRTMVAQNRAELLREGAILCVYGSMASTIQMRLAHAPLLLCRRLPPFVTCVRSDADLRCGYGRRT